MADQDLDSPALRKERGAFFTPPELSGFVARWAIRSREDHVFEPSCGEAEFMMAGASRLAELGATSSIGDQLQGVEIHQASADAAIQLLRAQGVETAGIDVANFFDVPVAHSYDAVIGNPPYVRYQDFSGTSRAKANAAARASGVTLSGLASSWAHFVVRSAEFLKPTGRLGLVLPAELLTVNYAAPVREFLMRRFGRLRLVLFTERVFPGALEEVVLLLAEGTGPTASIEISQARNLNALHALEESVWRPPNPGSKWTAALLPQGAGNAFAEVSNLFEPLSAWGSVDLGTVTGNNSFFTLSLDNAKEHKLDRNDLIPISPPGSRHLGQLRIDKPEWTRLGSAGQRVFLFYPRRDSEPSEAAKRYIRLGEKVGVPDAYKCSVRTPWWRVPVTATPDLILTYMNHDRPRLAANTARLSCLNSVHGMTLATGLKRLGRAALPIAFLNSATLLGAELQGRSYGGGLLKIEPREADGLPVPSPEHLAKIAPQLRALSRPIKSALTLGDSASAIAMVDSVVFDADPLYAAIDLGVIRGARKSLVMRRVARGKESPVGTS